MTPRDICLKPTDQFASSHRITHTAAVWVDRIILGVGCALLSAHAAAAGAGGNGGEAGVPRAVALPANSAANSTADGIGSEHARSCRPGEDDRTSELCAQWKAADAGDKAAYWARWSFFLGIIGTLGLLWTLYYTRKAVRLAGSASQDTQTGLAIAARNADAAAEQVKIARETAQAELRPFLSHQFREVTVAWNSDERKGWNVLFRWTNIGTSPAEIVALQAFQESRPITDPAPDYSEMRARAPERLTYPFILPPTASHDFQAQFGRPYEPAKTIEELVPPRPAGEGMESLYVWCVVEYRNPVFDTKTVYRSSAGFSWTVYVPSRVPNVASEKDITEGMPLDPLTYVT
jgi:hypothetical protein